MDEICAAVAAKIFAAGSGYTILYEDELLDAIADETQKNREVLQAALKVLQSGGYIDVKYARGETFCIAALKKYEPQPALPKTESVVATTPVSRKVIWLTFLGGVIGGAVGGIAGSLLAALAL
jgi:hypothetical protein